MGRGHATSPEILPQKAKSGLSGGPGDRKDKTLTLIEKDMGKLTAKER